MLDHGTHYTKGMNFMFEIIQESTLPKLNQTSLYAKFDESSGITKNVIAAINNMKNTRVTPDKIPEILSLIKLNGDAIAKKSVAAYEKGEIIILNDKDTSKVPTSLPYIVMTKDNKTYAFIFAERVCDNINSSTEYTKLMAVMEAAYLALSLRDKPNKFTMNRALILSFCNLYCDMVTAPLEQKLYVKGENLTKMRLYTMAYFYRIIDGEAYSTESFPSIAKRVVLDKVDAKIIKQIGDEVGALEDTGFMNLVALFKKINPVRYADLDSMYMSYFTTCCGLSIMFALENLQYLFLLMTSSLYKTGLTGFALNKEVIMVSKKAMSLLVASI